MSNQSASEPRGVESSLSKKSGPRPPPGKHNFRPAIISFVSGDHIVAMGSVNKHGDEDVQDALTINHNVTDLPFIGYRIRLRRSEETKHLYEGENRDFHTVLFSYLRDNYRINHRHANDRDKQRFLNVMGGKSDPSGVLEKDALYLVRFSHTDMAGPDIHGFGSSFVGATNAVQDKYNHLSSIASNQTIDFYLWEGGALSDQLTWSIADQAARTDPLQHYYMPSKNQPKPQARVQWHQLREKDIKNTKPFQRRQGFHNFEDFTVMHGYSEAYEQEHIFLLSKRLRDLPVKMAVLQPSGSSGDYYFAFLFVNDWEMYQRLFDPHDRFLVTWTPAPEFKPSLMKEEGDKDPVDKPAGWTAIVMEDNVLFSEAPLMIMLCRPGKDKPLADKEIRAAQNLDESMPVQKVYLKTYPSAVTIKARLNALDKHRYRNNDSPEFDEKRRLLVGRDLSVRRNDDLLEGIPEEKVKEVPAGLNPSQVACLETYCRDVHHGVNLIRGPFGSGKTVLVSKLCELQKLRMPASKTFVAASSDSACDAVIPKFATSDLMVVRAHALSLERETLLKAYFKARRQGKLSEADPVPEGYQRSQAPQAKPKNQTMEIDELEIIQRGESAEDLDDESGPEEDNNGDISDEMILEASLDILKLCEKNYESRVRFLSPTDPRMKQTEVAIHTWILKFAGIIGGKYAIDSTGDEACTEFRALYEKSKTQLLNIKEWSNLKKSMSLVARMVLNAADVIVATTIQAQTDLLKDVVFDHVIIDETSMLTHVEMLCAWRGTETLTLIGDLKQLPSTVSSSPDQNPFARVLSYGPFQRFADLGLRVFPLRHVMRMTAGLEELCNTIFYDGKLICGPRTSPTDPKRQLSSLIQRAVEEGFPELTKAPAERVYPVFLNVAGTCGTGEGGSSRMNAHNIALAIDFIQRLRAKLAKVKVQLQNHRIGIVTPYTAQVRLYRRALTKAGEVGIRVGVTESWRGAERDVMFVDFVRAKDPDCGDLGFLTKKERLNVLLSRQRQFLFVIGDVRCCESAVVYTAAADKPADGNADEGEEKTWGRHDKKNVWMRKVLTWFWENGRVMEFAAEKLSDEFITLRVEGKKGEEDDRAGFEL